MSIQALSLLLIYLLSILGNSAATCTKNSVRCKPDGLAVQTCQQKQYSKQNEWRNTETCDTGYECEEVNTTPTCILITTMTSITVTSTTSATTTTAIEEIATTTESDAQTSEDQTSASSQDYTTASSITSTIISPSSTSVPSDTLSSSSALVDTIKTVSGSTRAITNPSQTSSPTSSSSNISLVGAVTTLSTVDPVQTTPVSEELSGGIQATLNRITTIEGESTCNMSCTASSVGSRCSVFSLQTAVCGGDQLMIVKGIPRIRCIFNCRNHHECNCFEFNSENSCILYTE